MQYLEDFMSEQTIDALEFELKKIYNNEEFIMCTLSAIESDDEGAKLLEYLRENTITQAERYKVTLFQMQLEKARKKTKHTALYPRR